MAGQNTPENDLNSKFDRSYPRGPIRETYKLQNKHFGKRGNR